MGEKVMVYTSAFSTNIHSLGKKRNSVTMSEPAYKWGKEITLRLDELTHLEEGWDGYKGKPVTFENAAFTLEMLKGLCEEDTPAPQIVPGTNGDLQVEWHTANGDVELHILAPYNIMFWANDHSEEPITSDYTKVFRKIRTLMEQSNDRVATA
jgi:hypothetical protein